MSATNRGAVRNPRDFYKTPLPAFTPLIPFLPKKGAIWEPAAGDGGLVFAMHAAGLEAFGTDIEPQHDDIAPIDFLKITLTQLRDTVAIVTNPPFSLAMEFCDSAVVLAPETFMLLRLPFLASAGRQDWFQRHPVSALFVLSKRPSFTADGKTDATDYAWFYWGERHRGIFHL